MLVRLLLTGILASALLLAIDPKLLREAEAKINEKKFSEAITMLYAAYKNNPKDPLLAQALANAHLKYGDSYMYSDQIPATEKFPNALRQYRNALVYDKTNPIAKKNIEKIEALYKKNGKQIP